jgi:hypothetical protein
MNVSSQALEGATSAIDRFEDEPDEAVSESGATDICLKRQALEHDGCQCRRCGATGVPPDYDPDTLDVDLDWMGIST